VIETESVPLLPRGAKRLGQQHGDLAAGAHTDVRLLRHAARGIDLGRAQRADPHQHLLRNSTDPRSIWQNATGKCKTRCGQPAPAVEADPLQSSPRLWHTRAQEQPTRVTFMLVVSTPPTIPFAGPRFDFPSSRPRRTTNLGGRTLTCPCSWIKSAPTYFQRGAAVAGMGGHTRRVLLWLAVACLQVQPAPIACGVCGSACCRWAVCSTCMLHATRGKRRGQREGGARVEELAGSTSRGSARGRVCSTASPGPRVRVGQSAETCAPVLTSVLFAPLRPTGLHGSSAECERRRGKRNRDRDREHRGCSGTACCAREVQRGKDNHAIRPRPRGWERRLWQCDVHDGRPSGVAFRILQP
jgi:hypothetical protein